MDNLSNQTTQQLDVDTLPTSDSDSASVPFQNAVWTDESPGQDLYRLSDDSNPFAIEADECQDVAPLLMVPAVTPPPCPARPMNKRRFATGLLFATSGIALMLTVALGALQSAGANGRLSLPAVAVCMIIGLMLLGGGFGVMATAAATFDDAEFDRLMHASDRPLPTTTAATLSPDSESMPSRRSAG
ncbi:MAG: hypothetical protein R3C59_29680 [Planctomycetaceae bacterium]